MIQLKHETTQSRINIARQSEPFYLQYKKDIKFIASYNVICKFLSRKENRTLHKEIWTLISATTQTIRYNSVYTQLPMDNNVYTLTNSTSTQKLSLARMTKLLNILEGLNLLTVYKGFRIFNNTNPNNKGVTVGMRTCVKFNKSWNDLFKTSLCISHGTPRRYDLIIMKDGEGNVISNKGIRGIGKEKLFLKSLNMVIEKSEIAISGVTVKPIYTIIYNNSSLKAGGRIYGGLFTNEKSFLRQTITINGEPTCEVDFANMHFMILYCLKNIKFDGDAYKINMQDGWDADETRKVAKLAGLILLNSSSIESGVRALVNKMNSMKLEYMESNSKTARFIFNSLKDIHHQVEEYFFRGGWWWLQNYDGLIARYVLKSFIAKDEACLCYHDSFVVVDRLKEYLIDTMKEAWEDVLDTPMNCRVDIEFENNPPAPFTDKPIFNKTGEIL